MKQKTRDRIIKVFRLQQGIVKTKDVLDAGIHNLYLSELENEGTITKIKRGLYVLKEMESENGFIEVQKAVPDGVICLGSAMSYYELSSYEAPSITIAVKRGKRFEVPQYPPVKVYFFSIQQYTIGISTIDERGEPIKIYNLEKTICDLVRYRNKLGTDIVNESVRTYLSRKDRNLQRLYEYSRQLRIETIIRQYIEVLL